MLDCIHCVKGWTNPNIKNTDKPNMPKPYFIYYPDYPNYPTLFCVSIKLNYKLFVLNVHYNQIKMIYFTIS